MKIKNGNENDGRQLPVWSLLLVGMFFCACSSVKKPKESFIDYMIWTNNNGDFREYVYKNDSSMMRIFIRQTPMKITDDTWEMLFEMKRADSIPISKSVERYSDKDYYELISSSMFSMDSSNSIFEIKGAVSGDGKIALSDKENETQVTFRLNNIDTTDLHIKVHLDHKFETMDSLGTPGEKYMVLQMKSTYHLTSVAKSVDTTYTGNEFHIYQKNKGLIFFGQKINGEKIFFRLKEN